MCIQNLELISLVATSSIEIRSCCIFYFRLGENAQENSAWVKVRSRSIGWRSTRFGPSSSKLNEGKKSTKNFFAEQHDWGRQSQKEMLTRLQKSGVPRTLY